MPLTHMISPDDKSLTPVEDAAAGSLDPWFPRAFILEIIDSTRDYDGTIPHVTGLLNGPRKEWLEGKIPYAIDPDGQTWSVVGSAGHFLLEKYAGSTEVELANDYMQGRLDNLVSEGDAVGIEDYKVWGSFKIAKTLGTRWESQPIIGEDGVPERYGKRAQKAGQVKTRRVMVRGEPDLFDLRAQLNGYRVLWEEQSGQTVDWLRVFLIARESGTAIARQYQLDRGCYRVDIDVVRTGDVEDWFRARSDELRTAWEKDEIPRPCDEREAWGGRRCRGYCPVADACREAGNPWRE